MSVCIVGMKTLMAQIERRTKSDTCAENWEGESSARPEEEGTKREYPDRRDVNSVVST